MGIPSESFIKWISRHLSDITSEGAIHHFDLNYDSGKSLFRLDVFAASDDGEVPNDAAELASHIYLVAEEDAKSRHGYQHRYAVMAYRADVAEHESVTSFQVQGKLLHTDVQTIEPGNEEGVTAQLMRHNEQIMMTMQRVVESTLGRLAQDHELERNRRLELERGHADVIRLREELMNNQEEREARRREEERKAERSDQVLSMFLQSAPLLLAAVGSAISKMGSSSSSSKIQELLGKIDEGKLSKFIESLSPDEQTIMLDLIKK